jgi:acetamidase/formamidase
LISTTRSAARAAIHTTATFIFAALTLNSASAQSQTKTLLATPDTVVWGAYGGALKPALTINSGDTVTIQTLSTCGNPKNLIARGVAPADIPSWVQTIFDHQPDAANRGPGGHLLTGPVAVEGAAPGDVLEVRIQKIDIDVPWACNGFGVGRGFLPDDFPYSRQKLIPLDRQKMIGHFAPGVDIPLHPFFGSMGIAVSAGGRTDSAPPWMNGGNMDNKDLVAGTTIFFPVNSRGANFEVGDGHANQGNGEVDITALETQLTGTFQFILHKSSASDPLSAADRLEWPRAVTPTAYIAMGFHEDLKRATEMAIRNMIAFLSSPSMSPAHPALSRADAYALISVACDVDITQLVDLPRVGVHVLCPKDLFTSK